MQPRHGSLTPARLMVLGAVTGVSWWPWWMLVLLAPTVDLHTGVSAGYVLALLQLGGAAGSLLARTGLGRRRRRVTIYGVGAASLTTAGLGQLTAWPLAGLVIVLVSLLLATSDLALQSAITATLDVDARASGLLRFWIVKGVVLFVGGPLYEWAVGQLGFATTLSASAVAAGASSLIYARLCPDPDRAAAIAPVAPVAQERSRQRSSPWLVTAGFCVAGQVALVSQSMPLALADHAVGGVGVTQFAFVAGTLAMVFALSKTATSAHGIGREALVVAAPLIGSLAAALALVGELFATAPTAILSVAVIVRILVVVDEALHACVVSMMVGERSSVLGTVFAAHYAGGLACGALAGVARGVVAPALYYELIQSCVLGLGLVAGLATWRWLARR